MLILLVDNGCDEIEKEFLIFRKTKTNTILIILILSISNKQIIKFPILCKSRFFFKKKIIIFHRKKEEIKRKI